MDKIRRIQVGMAGAWLAPGRDGFLLVDSGPPGMAETLFRRLGELSVKPGQIRLAVCTHVHFDHVGNIAAIKDACRCPVLVHQAEAPLLEQGIWEVPDGTLGLTRAAAALGRRFPGVLHRRTRYAAVNPDIVISSPRSLEEFGFAAEVLPTPGHTAGSLSVLTRDGHAFVGDLAYNELPFLFKHRRPPFANDLPELARSWRSLVRSGAKTICPGHGRAFDAGLLGVHPRQ